MMIDSREREIFIRQVRHFVDSFVDVDAPRPDLFEEFL
jgi:hypothetical protein